MPKKAERPPEALINAWREIYLSGQMNITQLARKNKMRPCRMNSLIGPYHHKHAHKYSDEQVTQWRKAYFSGESTIAALAKQYGIEQTCMGRILGPHRYKHVVVEVPDNIRIRREKLQRRLPMEAVVEMRQMHFAGVSQSAIQQRFGISKSHISEIVRGIARKKNDGIRVGPPVKVAKPPKAPKPVKAKESWIDYEDNYNDELIAKFLTEEDIQLVWQLLDEGLKPDVIACKFETPITVIEMVKSLI